MLSISFTVQYLPEERFADGDSMSFSTSGDSPVFIYDKLKIHNHIYLNMCSSLLLVTLHKNECICDSKKVYIYITNWTLIYVNNIYFH